MNFTNFLILLLVITALIVVIAQIARLGDMVTNLKDDPEKAEEEAANNLSLVYAFSGFLFLALLTFSYFYYKPRYLPEAASELGRSWDWLFGVFSIPIIIVFFITHIVLFYFIRKYRYKKDRPVYYFPESHKLELIWTAVPAVVMVLLVGLGIPKWNTATSKAPEDALNIRVTGMQFKWMFNYPGADEVFGERYIRKYGDINNLMGLNPEDEAGYDDLFPDNIVVPINKPVNFQINSLDVLHDFYLPDFRMKIDAVPGVPTSFWILPDKTTAQMREETGNPNFEFEIACAELCGSGHWNMRKTLTVVEQDEYDAWIAEQALGKDVMYKNILDRLKVAEEKQEIERPLEEEMVSEIEETEQH